MLGGTDLTGAQRDSIRRCANPGWLGMVRLLVQERETPCGSVWVGRTLGSDASAAWQVEWLQDVATDQSRPSRQRFRAALGGVVNERAAPVDMMLLADRSELDDKDWETLWRALFDASFDTSWMDPIMRDRAKLWRHFDQGEHDLEEMLPVARRWSRSAMGPPERQAQLSALFWYEVGIGDGHTSGLSRELEIREGVTGRPDEPLDSVIARYAGDCKEIGDNTCLVYALAAWEMGQQVRPEDWAELEPANDPRLEPSPLAELLNIVYEGDVRAVTAATNYLERISVWAKEQPDTQQERVFALLVRQHSLDAVIDPTAAFSDYGAGPWSTALAVDLTLGDQVTIFEAETSGFAGPYIQLGSQWLHADSEGLRSVSPRVVDEPMKDDDIYALAVVEMAVDRALRREFSVALRLAGMAERTSVVANGVSAVLAQRCRIAEGANSASKSSRLGAWSHGEQWPQTALSAGEKRSIGVELLLDGLDEDC